MADWSVLGGVLDVSLVDDDRSSGPGAKFGGSWAFAAHRLPWYWTQLTIAVSASDPEGDRVVGEIVSCTAPNEWAILSKSPDQSHFSSANETVGSLGLHALLIPDWFEKLFGKPPELVGTLPGGTMDPLRLVKSESDHFHDPDMSRVLELAAPGVDSFEYSYNADFGVFTSWIGRLGQKIVVEHSLRGLAELGQSGRE
jgi:hypothetical protein